MENMIENKRGVQRESNFELLRIIMILAIIAHHYAVNSGIVTLYNFEDVTHNMIFLQLFGMFGKIGINCFTLITGYFMVNSSISVRKFIKLYLQVKFWYILFYLIFLFTGYEPFQLKTLFRTVFSVVYEAGSLYTGTFLIFYLCIPFLNMIVRAMNIKQYHLLLLLMFTYFTVISTFFKHDTFNFVGWLCTMYFTGGYIRIFPCKYFEKRKYATLVASISLLLGVLSVLIVDFIGSNLGFDNYYYMVSDAHKFLAVTTAVSIFLWFKNTKIKYSKVINKFASATFGVLLVHANSDTMRRFLWKDLFHNSSMYESKLLLFHAVACVLTVYIIAAVLEFLREKFIEKPMMKILDKRVFLK